MSSNPETKVVVFKEVLNKKINYIACTEQNEKIIGSEFKIYFHDGTVLHQYHDSQCCENVEIEDSEGDTRDFRNAVLLQAEMVSQEVPKESRHDTFNTCGSDYDCQSWTFVKFATVKGSLTIRWWGGSNGYYSITPVTDIEYIQKIAHYNEENLFPELKNDSFF